MVLDEAVRVLTQWLARGGAIPMLALAAGALALSGPVARRLGTSRWLALAALLSVALVIGVTLTDRQVPEGVTGLGSPLFACLDTNDCWERVIEVDLLWRLNLAMFLPGGVLLTLATRRPPACLAGLVALSAMIEVAQGLFSLGAPDPGDLLANSLGALLGVALGAVILRTRSGGWSPRSVAGSMIAVVVVAASAWIGLTLGANARLDALTAEVSLAFAGTTSADIAAGLTEAGSSSLFSRASTRPDYIGQVGDTEEYGARYSTQFLGFDRCVFVRWNPSGMSLSSGSGTVCTEFRDRP